MARWLALILAAALLAAGCASTVPRAGPESGARTVRRARPPVEVGIASYYARRFRGARTASGQRHEPDQLVAAHRTLPFGTRVRVTNLENRRSVVVLINDRGPFVEGRVIDVSRRAARELGFLGRGLTRVRLEVRR